MNFRSIMMFLIAALTLLGVGAPALAAETAQIQAKDKEVSFNQCSVNGRLKFKDGKDGCLDNHPTFLKQGATQSFFPKQQPFQFIKEHTTTLINIISSKEK